MKLSKAGKLVAAASVCVLALSACSSGQVDELGSLDWEGAKPQSVIAAYGLDSIVELEAGTPVASSDTCMLPAESVLTVVKKSEDGLLATHKKPNGTFQGYCDDDARLYLTTKEFTSLEESYARFQKDRAYRKKTYDDVVSHPVQSPRLLINAEFFKADPEPFSSVYDYCSFEPGDVLREVGPAGGLTLIQFVHRNGAKSTGCEQGEMFFIATDRLEDMQVVPKEVQTTEK